MPLFSYLHCTAAAPVESSLPFFVAECPVLLSALPSLQAIPVIIFFPAQIKMDCCIQAVCCQIMAVPADLLQRKPQDEAGNTWKYPATAVVYMARDQRTALGVADMTKGLAEQVSCPCCYDLQSLCRELATEK